MDERRRREEGHGGEAEPEDELGRPPLGVPRVAAVVHLPRVHGGQEHDEEEEEAAEADPQHALRAQAVARALADLQPCMRTHTPYGQIETAAYNARDARVRSRA